MLPKKLHAKMSQRKDEKSLRTLSVATSLIDFCSNDYLGFSQNKNIFSSASEILKRYNLEVNGATGSRLLTGNHTLYSETEKEIATFHNTQSALIYNSGYDANLGFFSSVPQKGDLILYDELCHASIRDGINLSNAKAYKFTHNNLIDIEKQLTKKEQSTTLDQVCYLVTESVFSMDGDQPDLKAIAALCKKYNCLLVVDEAHAIGVFGDTGQGLVQQLKLENEVFARIITFGKALGCHGAAILGSQDLQRYLINFSRSFIYTTGLPPHSIATIQAAYNELEATVVAHKILNSNIAILQNEIKINTLQSYFISSHSAIQCCIIGGNSNTKKISEILQSKGFNVKAILSPTVPKGQERLRICLHSFNTKNEIRNLLKQLSDLIKNK